MNKKISLGAAIAFMAIIAAATFAITMVFSLSSFNDRVNSLRERENMYKKLAEIDSVVRLNFYGDIDEDILQDSIANGYVGGLTDKYGKYLTAEQYAQLMQDYDGTMVGIGIEGVKDASGYMKVTNVYSESSAEFAGIQVGDLIIKVDNTDLTAENYDQVIDGIKGEAGTKIDIVYRRDAEDTTVTVTRRSVEVPVVEGSMVGEVGYVKIKEFTNTTYDQFDRVVNKLMNESGAKALVFDVRNNPGGTVTSVSKILDKLLPAGDIVSATYKNGKTEVLATSDSNEINLPMAVLANQNSASASELFAQALKDYEKAKIVGVTTKGKGSMQKIYKLSDGSALDITIAKYNPPKSSNFDGIGVKPDYEVKLTDEQEKYFEELTVETDPQLKKALEVVSALIASSQNNAQPDSSSVTASQP